MTTEIKKLINTEVNELTGLLEAVKVKIEKISLLYPHLNNAKGIEEVELTKLIAMCEGIFSDDLAVFTDRVKQLAKARVESKLILKQNGRYSLDGLFVYEFTSGSRIEVYIDEENHDDYGWQFGRIEHSEKFGGYYFFNEGGAEHHKITTGMLAAVRI